MLLGAGQRRETEPQAANNRMASWAPQKRTRCLRGYRLRASTAYALVVAASAGSRRMLWNFPNTRGERHPEDPEGAAADEDLEAPASGVLSQGSSGLRRWDADTQSPCRPLML